MVRVNIPARDVAAGRSSVSNPATAVVSTALRHVRPRVVSVSLVVGAGGFVGRHLCDLLEARGDEVAVVSTQPGLSSWGGLRLLEDDPGRLESRLAGVSRLYFVGGVAHGAAVGGDGVAEVLARVNVDAPLRWLRAADRAGVERFVWLSSIKVLGDVSAAPLQPDAPYRPGDAYARSKVAAERALLGFAGQHTSLAVVRPPLVYGPGVGANFLRLLHWARGGLPLPLGRADGERSLVSIDNLCDLLARLGGSGDAGVFHVADDEAPSVAHLIARLRALLGRPARLWPLPRGLAHAGALLVGRNDLYRRLFEPLRVDTRSTRDRLGWTPPQSLDEGLQDTVTWFRTLP